MRFNFLVLCTTFVHTWNLGNGNAEQHTVWMRAWVSMPSSENSSIVTMGLDSFKVERQIYAGLNPTRGGGRRMPMGQPDILPSPISRPTPRGGRLLRSSPTSRRALQGDPDVEVIIREIVNHRWFVNGYAYKENMLCSDGSVGNVKLDGAVYLPSLVFHVYGEDWSKQLTLKNIKIGFQLGSPRTWFISNNCFPFNGNQDKPEEAAIHFSCCIVTDELGELYDMMVYAKPIGFNDYGSGTAGYFGYFDIAYGPLDKFLPYPVNPSGYGCLNGKPTPK